MGIIEKLDVIAGISSRKTKARALKMLAVEYHPVFMKYLVKVYDPFQKYQTYDNVAHELLNITLNPELITRAFKKDLRIGVGVKTINSIWPGLIPTHNVMLAQTYEETRATFPCWSTFKIDGVRAIFRNGEFYFRNGKIIQGLDHLIKELEGQPVLDGELLCPEFNFQQSSGNIRAYKTSPTAEFHLIDIPEHSSTVFADRVIDMLDLSLKYPGVQAIQTKLLESHAELHMHFREAIKWGYEGLVVKPMEYEYEDKRSYNWMKLKVIETEDLYVEDIFEGTGKYSSMLGGVIVNRNSVRVRVGSGFSDSQRDFLWNNPDSIIGRTIEVKYHEVTPDGSLRHPVFLRFRDDKEVE